MTADEAVVIAERERAPRSVPGSAERCPPELRWIEVGERLEDGPWRVRDLLVWGVRFVMGGAWIDLLISDVSGQVVRVDKSRGYVLGKHRAPQEGA